MPDFYKFARIICKPFKLRDIPQNLLKSVYYEEVIGSGFHPERIRNVEKRAKPLLSHLPRIALDILTESEETIEKIRLSLRTGEWGDGKIFVLPIIDFIEF